MTPEEVRSIARQEWQLVCAPACEGRHTLSMKVASDAAAAAARAHDRANEAKDLAMTNQDKLLTITNEASGGLLDVVRVEQAAMKLLIEGLRGQARSLIYLGVSCLLGIIGTLALIAFRLAAGMGG